MTNLEDLQTALSAYQKRFGIEEMFRDFKSGGYNLEETYLEGQRLVGLVLLISMAYSLATMSGETIGKKGQVKYVSRIKEPRRRQRRHSNFYIGIHGMAWVESLNNLAVFTLKLMNLSPHKRLYYQLSSESCKAHHVYFLAIVVTPSDYTGTHLARLAG